jgi:hypothetical protein
MSGNRVPQPLVEAYMAYLSAAMPDALAKWETFRDLCHEHQLDSVETANLVTCGDTLFL